MMNEPVKPELETEQSDEERKERGVLVIFRFVLVPLILVGVIVVLITFFGNLALKEKSVQDYLYDIRTGSKSERWQAAYHLSNLFANPNRDYTAEAKKHLPEMVLIFQEAKSTDPEIRRYMALALGRLQDPTAVPALEEAVGDEDSQTAIWSIWALGAIGAKNSLPVVLEALENKDSAIRAMAAYVLGALENKNAIPALQGHLEDSSAEVAWNAAIALTRFGEPSGAEILGDLLDRNYLGGFPNMTEKNREELMINAIVASTKIQIPALQERIKELSQSDPNPRVRDAALKAVRE